MKAVNYDSMYFTKQERQKSRNAKRRQSIDADTKATELIFHYVAALNSECSSGCLVRGVTFPNIKNQV